MPKPRTDMIDRTAHSYDNNVTTWGNLFEKMLIRASTNATAPKRSATIRREVLPFGIIQNQFFRCFLQGEPQTLPRLDQGRERVVQFNTARPWRRAEGTGIQREVSCTNDLG